MDNIRSGYQKYFAFIQPVVNDPLMRVYFSLALSLFLVTFLVIFALSPTINTVLGLRRKITDEEKITTTLDAKINALVAAGENYNQQAAQLALLGQALPDKPYPEGIIANVLGTATASGVTVSSLQFKPVALTGDDNADVGFSLSVAGSQTQLHDFLAKTENLLRYIRLGKLVIVFNGENGPTVDSQVTGYFLKNK